MGNKQVSKRLSHDVIWKLWDFIGIDNWHKLLKEYKPNLQFIPTGHKTLKGLCVHPDHQDTDPSFYIHTGRGYAKCYGGSCNYYESNPLRLISYIRNSTYADSLEYVQKTYKPGFLPKKALEELEAQRLNQELKREIFAATHQMMCDAIGDPNNSEYAYAAQALDWLINVRGLSKDVLHALPVSIMPVLGDLTKRIHKRFKIKYMQWRRDGNSTIPEPVNLANEANNYFADYIRDPVFTGGILLPLYSTPTEISNFKLRSPDSSKKFTITKDEFSEDLGMFGLGWDRYQIFWSQSANRNYAHIVEGEFDALSLMAYYVARGNVKFPVISAGGGGGAPYIEKCLRASGVNSLYLVGDAPEAKGDDVVQKWLGHIYELDVKVFQSWDKLPGASDVDDAIHKGNPSDVLRLLWDEQDTTFASTWDWASTRASIEIDSIPEQDFRARMEAAANHGKYVNHRLEASKFIEVVAARHNLNASLLKREIASRDGTELGFVQNCVDALREFLFVVGSYASKGGRNLKVYNTKDKRYHEIQLANPKSVIGELAPTVGSLHAFITEKVGQPPFLEFPTPEIDGRILNKLQMQLASYLDAAFIDMTLGAPDFMTARRLKQGYHCVRDHGGTVEYIVCGTNAFKIQRDGASLSYIKLEGPADAAHNTIFDVDVAESSAWYPGGLDVDKLESGKKVNLQKLYSDLVEVYDVGYCFKNQKVTAQLLAALVLCYPIMDAFERPVLVFITGDTHSGKSSLLSTLTGFNYKGIQLLLASQGYESYSAAGVAGYADSDSRLLALDEFESGDTERGGHVSKIMEMFRGLVSGQADRVRGRADGTAFTQTFRLPVIFSAIQGAERPQDLNRMLSIEMQKVPQKVNPVHVIQDTLGTARIKEMAHEIAVGMYPYAQDLARLEAEVRSEFIELQKTNPKLKIEWRLASSLFAILALLKFLGKDWVNFLENYIDDNTYAIQQTAVASETHGLLNAIMRNPCISQAEGPAMTASQMLVSPELRDDINASNKGLYFDERTKTLLFLVDQCTGMIPYHLRGQTTGAKLKVSLERHPSALSPSEIERSGILFRVGRHLGAGINIADVVVLDAKPWLQANDSHELDQDVIAPLPEIPQESPEEQQDDNTASVDSWEGNVPERIK